MILNKNIFKMHNTALNLYKKKFSGDWIWGNPPFFCEKFNDYLIKEEYNERTIIKN